MLERKSFIENESFYFVGFDIGKSVWSLELKTNWFKFNKNV